jgi:hypothetical protein
MTSMLNKLIILMLLCCSAGTGFSQAYYYDYKYSEKDKGYVVNAVVEDGDTIPLIYLREVIIFPTRVFKNKKEAIRYTRLVKNVKKVLPYAKLARSRLYVINQELAKMKNESERKAYIAKADKELRAQFEDELKNLTISQGRLLIKLIDRETGATTYDLVRELKGSFNAFIYQSIAVLFGSSLKYDYDPEGDDQYIEEIVVKIENGQL